MTGASRTAPATKVRRGFALTALALVVSCCGGCFLSRSAMYPGCSVPCSPGPGVEVVSYAASDGIALSGAWVRSGAAGAPVLLWFHGNAESAGTSIPFARDVARAGSVDVFLAEYRGYGGLDGRPTEDGLYADAEGALAVVAGAGFGADRRIFGGRSLGTGVAVELACRAPARGVVLVSPYTSMTDVGRRIVGPLASLIVADTYATIDKVGGLDVPVIVIHGADDTTIPADQGRAVAAASKQGTFVAVEGAGHNDLPDAAGFVARAVGEIVRH